MEEGHGAQQRKSEKHRGNGKKELKRIMTRKEAFGVLGGDASQDL